MIYVLALAITATGWVLRYLYDAPPWPELKHCYEQRGAFMRGHLPVVRSTPDSERYLAMGRGTRACLPFHLRWLVPFLCGANTRAWHAVTAGSLIASGPALCWYATASGLTDTHALACVVAFTGLWGCFGLLTLCPLLVDAPAMLVALVGAGMYLRGVAPDMGGAYAVAGLVSCALILGAIKESGPVWLALFAWHPAALIGLLAPAVRALVPHPPPDHTIIANPFKSAMMYRAGTLTDGRIFLAPWGLGLVALLNPSSQLWWSVGVAYLQPLMASDVTRLVQQVAPVVLIHAIPLIPDPWLPLALAWHVFNPWQKTDLERQPVRLTGG